jgi:hypothetical protein
MSELPFVDVHSTTVAAAPEAVFEALERIGPRIGTDPMFRRYARLVGAEDVGAFHVARSERPTLVVLGGSHRFSRYELVCRIEPSEGGSVVRFETWAEFPGLGGKLYRAAVIGTGGHRIGMRLLLGSLRRRIERG